MNLNKVLLYTACSLFIIFLFITAGALAKGKAHPGEGLTKISDATDKQSAAFTAKKHPAFSKIGQLRISTQKDGAESSVVIITPVLEYVAEDESFYEELDKKTNTIRNSIKSYFASMTLKQINQKGENQIKQELLEIVNSILVLQKIEKIYFDDFQIL